MTDRKLRLSGWGLGSKRGFGDGDAVEQFINGLIDDKIIGEQVLDDLDDHKVLKDLVANYLLPAIPYEVVLYDVCTNHNPVRAERVGDLTDATEIYDLLEDCYVEIDWRDVVRAAGVKVVSGKVVEKAKDGD